MDTDINYIIQKSIKGDKIYQEILLKKLNPLIYKNIYKYYSKNDDNVEDLLHEGYIVILQSFKSFDINKNVHFLRYIKIKLYYFYKNYYRKTKKQKYHISLNLKSEDSSRDILIKNAFTDASISTEDKFLKKEQIASLLNFIKKLSIKEQEIINLCYEEGLSVKEISQRLNIPYRTASGRKYTALCKLKKMMRSKE